MNRIHQDKIHKLCLIAIFSFVFIIIILTFRDYGTTWDENVHDDYGYYLGHFFASFGKDLRALDGSIAYYGAIYDLFVYPVAHFLSPFSVYETRHLINAFVGLLGIFGAYKLGSIVQSNQVGLFCALSLVLTPSYYGHMFNNPKDIPFAVVYLWTLYFLLKWFDSCPKPGYEPALFLSISLGLLIAIRLGGLIAVPFIFGIIVFDYFLRKGDKNYAGLNYFDFFKKVSFQLLTLSPIVFFLVIAFWPFVLVDPIDRLQEVFRYYREHSATTMKVLTAGEMIPANNLPMDYLPRHLFFKMPAAILLGFTFFLVLFVSKLKNISNFNRQNLKCGVILCAIIFPLTYVILSRATLYDGIRHVLFVVPLIVCLSVIGFGYLWKYLSRKSLFIKNGFIVLCSLYTFFHIATMASLHPYQYVFYNSLVGGLQGAYGNYELDYWAHSYKEAVSKVEMLLKEEDKSKTYKVFVAGPDASAKPYFPEYLELTQTQEDADFIITFTRFNWHLQTEGEEVAWVKRMGVPLAFVKNNRKL